jgi:hypothetical protein
VTGENLTRRGFLGLAIGGVAAAAAVRAFPFRTYSFPSEIQRASVTEILLVQQQNFKIIFDPTIEAYARCVLAGTVINSPIVSLKNHQSP